MTTSDNKIICPKCNSELPQDSGFCQYCGSKIEKLSTTIDKTVEENNTPAAEEVVKSENESETIAKILASGIVEGQKATEANKESQPRNELDADFGLVPQKPIYTVGIDEQEKYLKSLRTINGEPIKWNRRGTMSVDGVNGMVDVYDTYLPSGEEYKTIYMNMYGAYRSTLSPKGFTLLNLNNKHNKSHTSKNVKVIVPMVILSVVIIIVSAIAVSLGIELSKGTQEQSNKGNQETSIDENTPKDKDYLYNWLLDNGELTSDGASVVYKEVLSDNRTYSLQYNASSPDKIFASYRSKNSAGYVIIVTIELFASGDEESNAEVVVYNKDNNKRGLKYYHNPQSFTANTPVEIVSYFGDWFPDTEVVYGKDDTFLEKAAARRKPMSDVENIGKKSIHSGMCSIIDWLDESLCPKVNMSISDLGYLSY